MKTTTRLALAATMTAAALTLTGCDDERAPHALPAAAVPTTDERALAAAPHAEATPPPTLAATTVPPSPPAAPPTISPPGPAAPSLAAAPPAVATPLALAAPPTVATPPTMAPIVRRVITNDINVEMPSSYEEVVGTACSSSQDAIMREDGMLHHRTGEKIRSCEGHEWTLNTSSWHEIVWQVDQTGNLFSATGRTDMTTLISEIVVTKLDPSGRKLWEKSIPTGKTEVSPGFMRVSPGGVYVGGSASGQLPGNPPEADGQPWMLRYDDDGELQWIRQMRKDLRSSGSRRNQLVQSHVTIDGNDNLYVLQMTRLDDAWLSKLDRTGEPVWSVSIGRNRCEGRLDVASDGSAIFYGGRHRDHACMTKLDDKGELVWSNTYAPNHSLVIDQAEGTTWTGRASGDMSFSVGEGSLVMVGTYKNEYENGSQPPPSFRSAWVVELDFDGQVQSSRNIRVGPLDVQPSESGSSVSFSPWLSRQLPNGDLRVVGTQTNKHKSITLFVALPGHGAAPQSAGVAASSAARPSLWDRFRG